MAPTACNTIRPEMHCMVQLDRGRISSAIPNQGEFRVSSRRSIARTKLFHVGVKSQGSGAGLQVGVAVYAFGVRDLRKDRRASMLVVTDCTARNVGSHLLFIVVRSIVADEAVGVWYGAALGVARDNSNRRLPRFGVALGTLVTNHGVGSGERPGFVNPPIPHDSGAEQPQRRGDAHNCRHPLPPPTPGMGMGPVVDIDAFCQSLTGSHVCHVHVLQQRSGRHNLPCAEPGADAGINPTVCGTIAPAQGTAPFFECG